jgi:cytochrome b561
MWKNTEDSYGIVSKGFHWILGVSYIVVLAVGFIMTGMEKGDAKWTVYGIHKAFGVLLLFLIALRIIWRMININPTSLDKNNKLVNFLAKSGHLILYILMVGMPLSGFIMSIVGGRNIDFFGLFIIPGFSEKNAFVAGSAYKFHINASLIFVGFIALHILASLFHHFYKKDQTLRRMLPW